MLVSSFCIAQTINSGSPMATIGLPLFISKSQIVSYMLDFYVKKFLIQSWEVGGFSPYHKVPCRIVPLEFVCEKNGGCFVFAHFLLFSLIDWSQSSFCCCCCYPLDNREKSLVVPFSHIHAVGHLLLLFESPGERPTPPSAPFSSLHIFASEYSHALSWVL